MIGRLLSYWEGNFSGAMLNFGGVSNHRSEKKSFFLPKFLCVLPSPRASGTTFAVGVSHRSCVRGAPWFPVSKKEIRSQEWNLSRTYGFFQPTSYVFFSTNQFWRLMFRKLFFLFQLMENWWFGLVVWDSRGTQKSLFKRGSQESKPPTQTTK